MALQWLRKGQLSAIVRNRKHDPSKAIALPGIAMRRNAKRIPRPMRTERA